MPLPAWTTIVEVVVVITSTLLVGVSVAHITRRYFFGGGVGDGKARDIDRLTGEEDDDAEEEDGNNPKDAASLLDAIDNRRVHGEEEGYRDEDADKGADHLVFEDIVHKSKDEEGASEGVLEDANECKPKDDVGEDKAVGPLALGPPVVGVLKDKDDSKALFEEEEATRDTVGEGLDEVSAEVTNFVSELVSSGEYEEYQQQRYGIPDEVFLHVLSYLSATELVVAQLVCKDWNRLVDDHALWKALVDDLCNAEGIPFHSADLSNIGRGNTWKQRYYVMATNSARVKNETRERWRLWLELLLETCTQAFILDHDFQVCAISDNIMPSVVELDDIFKGVGIKGDFPIPRALTIGGKSFTVLTSMPHNWTLGFWIIARDLRTNTGLTLVKTQKLVIVTLRERCDFLGQLELVQGTLKAAELLFANSY